ncbi:hypothetical protein OUZ56_010716 [Daphnia magna]|uniref:Uncharacterized protein n=3 Tax=Daphnia magna TaxID=35525 RepID=A0ABQ9YYE0_9CRUS|nr:hypothetical protein OUZ56_010716 [Daphnia magna]
MLNLLKDATFVQADVTFPGIQGFPYLMNMVAFNFFTMQFQVVARVLMSRVTTTAYKTAISKILRLVTNIHPEFEHGQHIIGWILDFSLAQRDGLAANLGENACAVIRGCEVHFKRNVQKISDKVNSDTISKSVFKKIAYVIPNLTTVEETQLAFDVLCGKLSCEDEDVNNFLLSTVKLSSIDLQEVNTSQWKNASHWAAWWSKPKVAKMFAKSFKEMSDEDWAICPRTTNAVEAQNKLSNSSHSSLLIVALEHWYREDKKACFKTVCASFGITTGVTPEKRKTMNEKKRRNRMKVKVTVINDCDDGEPPTSTEKSKSKNEESTRQSKRLKKRNEETENVGVKGVMMQMIAKTIWVKTTTKKGAKTNQHGWCEATIERINDEGEYVANYKKWKNNSVIIRDLSADTIRFSEPAT